MKKKALLSLNPGRGMGPCLFGMQMDVVRRLLGEPQEIITFPDEALRGDITFSYGTLSASLNFVKEYGLRLFSLECWNPALELNGRRIINRPLDALDSALSGINQGEALTLKHEGFCGDEMIYTCDKLRIMAYVNRNGDVVCVNNRSLWDPATDAPVWI